MESQQPEVKIKRLSKIIKVKKISLKIDNNMWNIDPESLKVYFPEIENYSKKCASVDCKHVQENECAVKKAVKEKLIRKDRYESYLSLLKSFNSNKVNEQLPNDNISTESNSFFTNIESVLKVRFKIHIAENQRSLNVENILAKLTIEEKSECLELICKLSRIELLDLSRNGKIYLSESINNLSNLKKLRIDENAINTKRDEDFVAKLSEKGIKVVIYSCEL